MKYWSNTLGTRSAGFDDVKGPFTQTNKKMSGKKQKKMKHWSKL